MTKEQGWQQTLHQPRRVSHGALHTRIRELESEYGMLTVEFQKLWRIGDLPETPAFSEWYRLTRIAANAGVPV